MDWDRALVWRGRGAATWIVLGGLMGSPGLAEAQGSAATPEATEVPATEAPPVAAPEAESEPPSQLPQALPDAPPDATTPTEAEPAAEEEPEVVVTAQPGKGFSVTVGDVFSAALRARVQMRDTIVARPEVTNEIQIRTLRLWLTGYVLAPETQYGIQLAFGGNDFENGSASPIFDAFIDFKHFRDFNLRVGQFFVPFDRARTVRESSLQSVDRAAIIPELTLDRDMGVAIGSQDLFGLDGKLMYTLGFFGGEGRNRFGSFQPGFLYTARIAVRPFGAFDEDSEGDLERRADPKWMLGIAVAYNQNTNRPRSTTGVTGLSAYQLGTVDYLHGAVDTVFKWRGFAFLGEGVLRHSVRSRRDGLDMNGDPLTEYTRRAIGYLAQTSYMFLPKAEVWMRWDEFRTPWITDPALEATIAAQGRSLSGGLNYYLNGHSFKLQADVVRQFGDSVRDPVGRTLVRLQLDATF